MRYNTQKYFVQLRSSCDVFRQILSRSDEDVTLDSLEKALIKSSIIRIIDTIITELNRLDNEIRH